MDIKQAIYHIETLKKCRPVSVEGQAEDLKDFTMALDFAIDLAESVLAVGAKMPEKKKHSDWDCGDAHCIVCEDRGYNRAIDDCRIAITGALLSVEEIEKRSNDCCLNCRSFSNRRLCGVESGEICREIATAIHSAQMEKLGGE